MLQNIFKFILVFLFLPVSVVQAKNYNYTHTTSDTSNKPIQDNSPQASKQTKPPESIPSPESTGESQDDAQNSSVKIKKIPPLPRHVLLPQVSYARRPDTEGEYVLHFEDHNFWIIVLMASWNKRSAEISAVLNTQREELKNKNIGVLALFSQNSEQDVEKWRLQYKPMYRNFYASRNFIDSIKNPKIPIIYLVGRQGEVLLKYELPTLEQVHNIISKSFILTGF